MTGLLSTNDSARWVLLRILVLGFVLLISLSACFSDAEPEPPSILRVGVLPDQDKEALQHRYGPLMTYLGREMATQVDLVVPDSYDHLVRLFADGSLEMAFFGGAAFVITNHEHEAVPLVMRDIDTRFSSYFVARADDPAMMITEFRDRRIAFGSELSTSGHFMPRFFLREQGLVPEDFFASVSYSGTHDATVTWVRDGKADLGAVNAEVVRAMLRDGRLAPDKLRIVFETAPYADYVWALRPGLGTAVESQLREAFLALSPLDTEHAEILGRMGAGGFLPARTEDFTDLRTTMAALPRFQETLGGSSN